MLYGAQHGFHGIALGELHPSLAVFIAIVPVLLYSFVGIELPSTAAEEMVDPRRDIPVAIARAGVGQALMYAIPILAVLLVLPGRGGHVVARADRRDEDRLHRLRRHRRSGRQRHADRRRGRARRGRARSCSSGCCSPAARRGSWAPAAPRRPRASTAPDRRVLGRVSERSGVPVVMGLVSGAVSMLPMVADLLVTGGDGQKYFSAALTVAIALIVLAYLLDLPGVRRAADRAAPISSGPFRVPGGMRRPRACSIDLDGVVRCSPASACCGPGFGTTDPDASLPAGFEGERSTFELLVLTPVVLVLALAALFHVLGRPASLVESRPRAGRGAP